MASDAKRFDGQASSVRPPVLPEYRRARVAVAVLFSTNGAVLASLLPFYPAIKAALGLNNAQFGLAVAAFPVGAIVAGPLAAILIRRFTSAKVGSLGTVGVAVALLSAAFAPNGWLFAASLLIAGGFDSVTDVAQNSHGLRVQRLYGRSILNAFHALWSAGALVGGLLGAASISMGLAAEAHLAICSTVISIVAVGVYKNLLPGSDVAESTEEKPESTSTQVAHRPKLWITLTLGALVLVAVGGAIGEEIAMTWSALYMTEQLQASAAVAPLALSSMMAMHFVGRITGDRLVDRFGYTQVARGGSLLAAVGLGSAALWPSIPLTLIGFGLVGLGVATLVPAAMHAADQIPGLQPGTGLTILSWLMRLGFLATPPLVGAIADATSLRAALVVVPVASVLVFALAPILQPERKKNTARINSEMPNLTP